MTTFSRQTANNILLSVSSPYVKEYTKSYPTTWNAGKVFCKWSTNAELGNGPDSTKMSFSQQFLPRNCQFVSNLVIGRFLAKSIRDKWTRTWGPASGCFFQLKLTPESALLPLQGSRNVGLSLFAMISLLNLVVNQCTHLTLYISLFYFELDCNICDRRNKAEIGMSRFERLVATCKCDFAKNENGLSGENDHQESEPLSLTPAAKQVGCQVKCKLCSSRPAMLLDQPTWLRIVDWVWCNRLHKIYIAMFENG